MEIINLRLSGVKKIVPRVFKDERGFFFESYSQPLYLSNGIETVFVQDNVSFSKKGTVRGLHYQSSPGQAKLVSCVSGKIWDVVVDLRPDSATFGEWVAVELDDQEHHQLYIPIGFAHGFAVMSETARIQYKVSAVYNPKTECSIRWNDPDLQVAWPVKEPILSPRDQTSPYFKEVFYEVVDHRR
ncbi:MAG TPA: dTDP-4-dehydrorhamnose 3,5-epimerase [Chlamydiales bacterium]|nr:dTDP-4-dehydrorhamnose 3,5-epimerase [Chlamydiales bacterium]